MNEQRKQRSAGDALEASEVRSELFERAVRAASIGVWEWDVVTNEVTWSDEVLAIFGLEREAFAGTYAAYLELIFEDERARVVATIERAIQEGEHYAIEHRIRLPAGGERWIAAFGGVARDSDAQPLRMLGIVMDVSDRKLSEERLHESEHRFRALAEAALEGIVFSEAGQIMDANQTAATLFGYRSAGELVGLKVEQFVHPADRERVFRNVRAGSNRPYVHRGLRKDKTLLHLEATGRMVTYRGRTMRMTSLRDVTELVKSDELLSSIVDNSRDWIWAMDLNGRLTFTNPVASEIVGWSQAELMRTSAWDLMHPDDVAPTRLAVERAIADKSGWEKLLVRWRHRNGGYRSLESTGQPTFDEDGVLTGFRGVDRDVTDRLAMLAERVRLEEQLRHSQKMEAVGQLAGGVAHDFNNLLMVIAGNAQLLGELARESALDNPDLSNSIDEITHATRRATELTTQLLAFSRRQVTQPEVVDLNQALSHLQGMLRRILTEDLHVSLRLAPALPPVFVDPGQLEQVVLNLVVNARDAMSSQGQLTLSTALCELSPEAARAQLDGRPGTFVVLAVTDTGQGMDKQTITRVFEPFFTTKGVGQGTGLGLSTVYGIVQQAGGFISIESEVGVGSTFSVHLPTHSGPKPAAQAATGATVSFRGSETILLCEDDDGVRRLAARMLRKAGYSVLEAANGAMALEIHDTHSGRIELLLTDVIMPDMNGKRLSELLTEKDQQLKTLFFSGYAADAISHHGVLDEGVVLLKKPFARAELLDHVRQVLDGAI